MSAGQPPTLDEVLAKCSEGKHELTKLLDLDNFPGAISWCRNCGSLIFDSDFTEPKTLGWKPRIFDKARQSP